MTRRPTTNSAEIDADTMIPRGMVIDMKLTAGKRILMFFHWLLSLLLVAAFAVYLIAPDFVLKYYNAVVDAIGLNNVKVIGIALLAIYVLLAVAQVILIFKRRKRSDRGFITVDSSDSGKVRIAIAAIEQMVRQSVGNIDGITEMKIGIENLDDAIGINVNATIVNGSHVPTITMNMQRAIRQFVETNCGVAVRTVSISINAVTNQPEARGRRRRGKRRRKLVERMDRTMARAQAMKLIYEWEMGGDGGEETRLNLLEVKPNEREADFMNRMAEGVIAERRGHRRAPCAVPARLDRRAPHPRGPGDPAPGGVRADAGRDPGGRRHQRGRGAGQPVFHRQGRRVRQRRAGQPGPRAWTRTRAGMKSMNGRRKRRSASPS